MADKKFKQSIVVEGDVTSSNLTANRALVSDSNKKIVQSTTTDTELSYLSGTTSSVQTQLNAKINSTEKGAANGVATLDSGGKVPVTQLPNSVMEFQGAWNASTNTPTLADGTGNTGDVYRVSVAGTINLGSGSQTFDVGDFAIYNGSIWQWSGGSDSVQSVFGRQGIVTAQPGDYTATQITNTPAGGISSITVQAAINELDSEKFNSADFNTSFDTRLATKSTTNLSEGTNLYFTDERAQDAVGNILTDSTTVDFTYNDAGNTISASVITQQSITSDASGVRLVGDSASPGNNKFYGTNGSGVKGFYTVNIGSAGDIAETSFSLANNQAAAVNVTGLAFSNAVRSFDSLVSVEIDASSDLFEVFKLSGIRRGADWQMSIESTGDNSIVNFTITSSGQVQYTSGNYAGFVSGLIKFRAITTSA